MTKRTAPAHKTRHDRVSKIVSAPKTKRPAKPAKRATSKKPAPRPLMTVTSARPGAGRASRRRESDPIPNCLTCGICCACNLVVTLEDRDRARLTRAERRRYILFPSLFDMLCNAIDGSREQCLPRMDSNPREPERCAALKGTVGRKVHCKIYDRRPDVCRTAIVPGEPGCLELRNIFLSYKKP